MIVPREPTETSTVPICETRIRDATRLVLSVPQRETIMIQKITIAPTSAKADSTCRERIQSFRSTARRGYKVSASGSTRSRARETHLTRRHVGERASHGQRLAEG